MHTPFKETWKKFATHYDRRLKNGKGEKAPLQELAKWPGYYYRHPKLRPGNGPRILYHGRYTDQVIVLTHGLTDCPHYLQAIAGYFFEAGCNVVMPLLPAHGLVRGREELRAEDLDKRWRKTIDHAVEIATELGTCISLGGFSTGGALSVNKALRDGELIRGGIFLFSGALSIGHFADKIGDFEIAERVADLFYGRGKLGGKSPDPYKYPDLPSSCASELVEIIKENKHLLGRIIDNDDTDGRQLPQPVFVAHSLHDDTAQLDGLTDFLRDHVKPGVLFVVSGGVPHSSVPLRDKIVLDQDILANMDEDKVKEWKRNTAANPYFGQMMAAAMGFFRKGVVRIYNSPISKPR